MKDTVVSGEGKRALGSSLLMGPEYEAVLRSRFRELSQAPGQQYLEDVTIANLAREAVSYFLSEKLREHNLMKRLEPFANAADNYADCKDSKFIDYDATLTVADLREARAALTASKSGEKNA